ncbi:cell wall metabolism sensor histidine kinase WalK [Planomicrobium sp. CPCC 101110]|uniref:sensor histidine kinase n=1 Tax=Planomicrobium sp. CPCC 101110 TaxID=2599619 RepID=UPI0011B4C942|nr:ATP-binding protein [Planomicrobium sp. CPCC 101110]TWT25832.1 cell wall metabolism sensor histidine kinase WalK [Planomicrobium sp. CPCC 101110]
MKLKKSRVFRKSEKSMFAQTRNRLTLFYSTILTLFLAVFVGIALLVFYFVITNEQEQTLRILSDREVDMAERALDGSRGAWKEQQRRMLAENQVFYYVIENDGDLKINKDNNEDLQDHYLSLVDEWVTDEVEVNRTTVEISENDPLYVDYQDTDMELLLLARPVKDEGERVAMLYMAIDNSFYSSIIKWIVLIFVGFALVFAVIGVVLSHWMSKRALEPVEFAYNLQREFVSNASHELRTPLSVILSAVEALSMEADKDNPFTAKVLGTLKHEVKRMSSLISELLALARSDSEQASVELKKEHFDIRPIAEQVVESFSKLGSEKQINLILAAPERVFVVGDRDKLAQLMYILMDNAIKYTPAGGQVEMALDKHSNKKLDEFVLSVSDTGIGILPEDQLKIFERFYRTDKVRSRKEGGFGLGLSIAKMIAAAHEGEIKVESEGGKGSIFSAKIPFSPKASSL